MKQAKSYLQTGISGKSSMQKKSRKTALKSTVLLCFSVLLFFCGGCSKDKKRAMPKTHPELLLELTETAKKNDYKSMLPKLARLQAIDPACAFIGELENTAKLNILVKEINILAAKGQFSQAYKKIEQYEKFNGPSPASGKVKERLGVMLQLENTLFALKNPKNSQEFHKYITNLESLKKKIRFSPALRNFNAKKRSELAKFRVNEFGRICFGLWSDALDLQEKEDPAYPVLTAILESTNSSFPGLGLLTEDL